MLNHKPWTWPLKYRFMLIVCVSIATAGLYYHFLLHTKLQKLSMAKTQQQQLKHVFIAQVNGTNNDRQTALTINSLTQHHLKMLQQFSTPFDSNRAIMLVFALCKKLQLKPLNAKPLSQKSLSLKKLNIIIQPIQISMSGTLIRVTAFIKQLHKLPWSIAIDTLKSQQQDQRRVTTLLLEVYHL